VNRVAKAHSHNVFFREAVHRGERDRTYAEADLFVLPTHSENFGLTVAEALAQGLPVICTTGAPWRALRENRCGWWVDSSVAAIGGALRDAMGRSDKEREEMGGRGRAYARQALSWPSITARLVAAYQWLSSNGPAPAWVQGSSEMKP
jgi:glycosyltransferase involved in cell wall biosynthesis